VYLPAYSPDYNPIERLWLRLKADWFWDFIACTEKELTDRLCTALESFIVSVKVGASYRCGNWLVRSAHGFDIDFRPAALQR
jgi:hypothetical protein